MSLKQALQQLCGNDSEIVIVKINTKTMTVDVLVPYGHDTVSIDIKGDNTDALAESFRVGLNHYLDQMIDHLEECKL